MSAWVKRAQYNLTGENDILSAAISGSSNRDFMGFVISKYPHIYQEWLKQEKEDEEKIKQFREGCQNGFV